MVWTQEEAELIAILDNFVARCAEIKKFQNINQHSLIQQVLAVTKGDVEATRKYCQQLLNSERDENPNLNQELVDRINYTSPSTKQNRSQVKNFKSYWTVTFTILALVTVFFSAKKSPHLSSAKQSHAIDRSCPLNLITIAKDALRSHNEVSLNIAISGLKQLQQQKGDSLEIECQKLLWETQYVYAIDFLASQGQRRTATKLLCNIPARYYENKKNLPWFSRWSNTNTSYSEWLARYKTQHNCSAAIYLE